MPFALRDAAGLTLVPRGGTVSSEAVLKQLEERGVFIDIGDADAFKKALAGKLDSMVRDNATIGRIARAEADVEATGNPGATPRRGEPAPTWAGLSVRLGGMLRDPTNDNFVGRVEKLDEELLSLLAEGADETLVKLIYKATTDTAKYSVHHAVLVAVMVELAARHLQDWPKEWRKPLRCAALTMNIAMTNLQDQLAVQDTPTSTVQREQIGQHAAKGAALLATLGVDDELWLAAVAEHHTSPPGPLADMTPASQLARLIRRADVFAARLSPRRTRKAMSATAAAKAAYLDENQKPDEAGAAIIKATGLYPPGSFVRLATDEVAIVLRRGLRANTPQVASIVGRNGLPIAKPVVRDTRLKTHEITGSATPHEVNVRLDIDSLLAQT
jgi:hypothetical protein